jgi:hypothetical protein
MEEAAMNVIRATVGQWYRGATNDAFEVVAIDDDDGTIEIQYFDGTVEELDFEDWQLECRDGLIEEIDAPEDWSGSVDIEPEDLDFEAEDRPTVQWAGSMERYPRRQ